MLYRSKSDRHCGTPANQRGSQWATINVLFNQSRPYSAGFIYSTGYSECYRNPSSRQSGQWIWMQLLNFYMLLESSTDLYLVRVCSTAWPVWVGCACGGSVPCCWDRPDPGVVWPDVSARLPRILWEAGPGQSLPGPGPGPGLGSPSGIGLALLGGRFSGTGPMYQKTCYCYCCCHPLDKLMERKQRRNVRGCNINGDTRSRPSVFEWAYWLGQLVNSTFPLDLKSGTTCSVVISVLKLQCQLSSENHWSKKTLHLHCQHKQRHVNRLL